MGEILGMENVDTEFYTNTHSHTHLQYAPRLPTTRTPSSHHTQFIIMS